MRSLEKPNPEYTYDPAHEKSELLKHQRQVVDNPEDSRLIPSVGRSGRVLLATWNIANLGVHKRRPADLEVIASIIEWFEIIAIQELADNLADFMGVMAALPNYFSYIFNDKAGNDERSAYIYDTRRVQLGPKVGEVVIVKSDRKYITVDGITRPFEDFNRNPLIGSFIIEGKNLVLANCHLLFGPQGNAAEKLASLERRQLEAYAIARWCDLRRKSRHAWSDNIIALGDFNLPRAKPGDAIYEALTERGLKLPPHETRIPTNVSNTYDYDQIAVTPGLLSKVKAIGVFDFDGVIYADIYDERRPGYWRKCAKYYISDHRPLWLQLEL